MSAERLAMELSIFGRMALAALFGFLVGLEREWRGKAAGERTFALLSVGAAAVTAVGVELFPASAEKVIAGVVTGVGFLGAGIIFRMEGGNVLGLTTASASWAVAAIGVVVGSGLYLTGALGTVVILTILEFDRLPLLRGIHAAFSHRDPPGSEPEP